MFRNERSYKVEKCKGKLALDIDERQARVIYDKSDFIGFHREVHEQSHKNLNIKFKYWFQA